MLLVVNAGSSSIKLAVFDDRLQQVLAGSVTESGGAGRLRCGYFAAACAAPDHRAALALMFDAMAGQGAPLSALTAAAHRVVHGGEALVQPCRITPAVVAGIESCVPLAPLHNPANLTAINALADLAPDLPQYASFDTAFHASNPAVAVTYALPLAERERGLRRYGFHGISYAGLVDSLGADVPRRLLALHGGEGAARILNRESGLLALGGTNDMRALQEAGTPEAAFARDHFRYWAVRHCGSLIAAMEGLDAIAFTGGIGENDAEMREAIAAGLAWAGNVSVLVVQAEEERTIAAEAQSLQRSGL